MTAQDIPDLQTTRDGHLRWSDRKASIHKIADLVAPGPDALGIYAFSRAQPGDVCFHSKPEGGTSWSLLIRRGRIAAAMAPADSGQPGRISEWRFDRFTLADLPHPSFDPHPDPDVDAEITFLSGSWQRDRLASIFHHRFSNGRIDGGLGTAGMPGLVEAGLVREDQTLTEIGLVVAERMARRCHARHLDEAERCRATDPEAADFLVAEADVRLRCILRANAANAASAA